jgi:scyllo-inositol 2-dehydrogenase (NADP+)
MIRRIERSFATRNDWQTERKYGGGYLLNWGPHIVDPPLILMNSRPKSVYGRLKQTINPGDVEDVFVAVMTLADGTIFQAEYTISTEPIPNWFIQGTGGTIVVCGRNLRVSRGMLAMSSDPTEFKSMQSGGDAVTEETIGGFPQGDEHEVYTNIAAAIRGEREFPVKPEDALELSRVLAAIRESSEQDRVISL